MAFLAMRLGFGDFCSLEATSQATFAAPYVFKVGDRLKVVGVPAASVSAEVVKFHSVGDRPHKMLVSQSVGAMPPLLVEKNGVAGFSESPGVEPAVRNRINRPSAKESLDGFFHTPIFRKERANSCAIKGRHGGCAKKGAK